MNQTCFVCNTQLGPTSRNAINIFCESPSKNSPVSSILNELLGRRVSEECVHSNIICRKCHKLCTDYNAINKKLTKTRSDLQEMINNTLVKHKLVDKQQIPMNDPVKEDPDKAVAKLVLPASKLHPLPANYMLNVHNINVHRNKIVKLNSINIQPKCSLSPTKTATTPTITYDGTIETSIKNGTEIINTTVHKLNPSSDMNICNALTNMSNTKKSQVIQFDINEPKMSKDISPSYKTPGKRNDESSYSDTMDQQQAMEIDEECNFAGISCQDSNLMIDKNDRDSVKASFLTVESLKNVRDVLVGAKIEPNDEEEQTIVMEDENGSILEMMSGRKFVYSGGELTLMMQSHPEDSQYHYGNGQPAALVKTEPKTEPQCDAFDVQAEVERLRSEAEQELYLDHEIKKEMVIGPTVIQRPKQTPDSNDETHIELQVSGDEETAKAIIAAAREQGGAFIKVESGEMYRVESVHSKSINEAENDEDNYSSAIVDMVKEENGEFTCLLCKNITNDPLGINSATVGNAEVMMAHLKTKHNARLYICTVCNCILRRRADHAKHCQTHQINTNEKKKAFACSICKKTYNSKTLLRDHMNMHTGKRPYSCSVCNKAFASKYTHQAHLKTHTDRPRPFKCNKCLKTFLNQANLTQHEKTHLGIKDFLCTVCNKGFSSQHNLEVHRVVHAPSKPYSCDHCGKSFARRNEVQDHIRTHTGERPFACDICGAAFTQRSNLCSHRKATHFNETRHACSICPKKFKRRRLLEYHIKATHTGERPLMCEICHTTFVYPEHFRKHKRIHSGEKPYDCEVCGKTFNSRDNRNTHRFVHSDKKPYECFVCGTGYMRKQLLYTHMTTSGHMAESIVVNQPRVHKVRTSDMVASSPSNTEKSEDDQPILIDSSELGDENKTDDGEERTKVYLTNTDSEQKYDGSYHRDGKSGINLDAEGEDNALFSLLSNMDENNTKEDSSQVAATGKQLTPNKVQCVTSGSDASNVRLVQVQIQGGGMVWVAIAGDESDPSTS